MKKWTLLLLTLFLFVTQPSYADSMNVSRISGQTRYETAVALSKATFTSSDYALVASGENFPDALGGGPLAIQLNAPILLVSKNQVPSVVIGELQRLGVSKIYLAGGPSAISSDVEATLSSYADVERLSGMSRYETNLAFLPKILGLTPQRDPNNLTHWYVNGTNFPDALAAAPYVAQMNMTSRDGSTHFLTLSSPGALVSDSAYAIGGPGIVAGTPKERIYGANRYETAVKIAQEYPVHLGKNISKIYLANGENFPDALAASPLIAKQNAALLLTKPNTLSVETKNFILNRGINDVVILGGPTAISAGVERELKALLDKEPEPGDDGSYMNRGLDHPYVDANGNGLIKGNINSDGEKIYHVPGMRDYNKTQINTSKGERWFKTEREARDAGWRMPIRY